MPLMSQTRGSGCSVSKWAVVLVLAVSLCVAVLYVERAEVRNPGQMRISLYPDDMVSSARDQGKEGVQNWMKSTLQAAIHPVEPTVVEEPKRKRQFEIIEPKVIADVSKVATPIVPGLSAKDAGYSEHMQHFVKGKNTGLFVNGKPFFITGFNNYYMVTRAPWKGKGRKMIDEVFRDAQSLGANTLRIWGFADGDEWNALQPELGIIDEKPFREGFDYVVSEAHKYGIRLLITLTNYWDAYGGMKQYVLWANKTSITDFYTDPAIKSSFKDYLYTVINRKNSVDGVLYRDNPSILGWEIANEPRDRGNPSSPALQSWIEEISAYVKQLDPNHLTMVGSEGFFGPSTKNPERLKANPYAQVYDMLSDRPYMYDAVCEGSDFEMNNKPDTIDVAVVHLYSDHWSACDESCKLDFASNWIRHHLEAAAELGRPLLIGEFGAMKPVDRRNVYLEFVHKELLNGAKMGYPVAGSIAWLLASGDYPDYDAFTLYANGTQAAVPRPPADRQNYEKTEQNAKLYNTNGTLACFDANAESLGWSEGWNDTMKEFKIHAQDLESLANTLAAESM